MDESLKRGTILLLGLGAQIIITALFLWRVVPLIEEDLVGQAEAALAARNIHWAKVEVSGRHLTLTGLAPTADLRQRAVEALEPIAGIRRLSDRIEKLRPQPASAKPDAIDETALIAELDQTAAVLPLEAPYEFRVLREGPLTTVSGMAPDQDARDSLIGIARQKFGSDRIIDRLVVNQNAPDGFLFAATQSLNIADFIAGGAVGLRDRELYVEGFAANDRDMEQVRSVIDATLPAGYTSTLQLGSRQQLDAVLRQNPDLAARIGPLPAPATRDDGGSRLAPSRPLDRSPEAAERCQSEFDALLVRRKIAFDTGSTDISATSETLLNDLVAVAKSCPGARIEIAGHTDDQGTDTNNLALSQRRAESVMAYLVSQGVALGRLTAIGYGEGRPLVENRTLDDRATNRRIEFKIL